MSDLAALNKQVADYDKLIARRDKFAKLMQNRLFQELILEDFIVQETARNASMAGDPNHWSDREYNNDAARAGGHLKRYINLSIQLGDIAERERPAAVEMIAEVMAEEDAVENDGEELVLAPGEEVIN